MKPHYCRLSGVRSKSRTKRKVEKCWVRNCFLPLTLSITEPHSFKTAEQVHFEPITAQHASLSLTYTKGKKRRQHRFDTPDPPRAKLPPSGVRTCASLEHFVLYFNVDENWFRVVGSWRTANEALAMEPGCIARRLPRHFCPLTFIAAKEI